VPVARDAWGRMEVRVPEGARRVVLRYEPPWRTGMLLGLVCAVIAALGAALSERLRAREGR